jgi:hypothetical protein
MGDSGFRMGLLIGGLAVAVIGLVIALIIVASGGGSSDHGTKARTHQVDAVSCPTSEGIKTAGTPPPSSLKLSGATSADLVAYVNKQGVTAIAPSGWSCSSIVGADGGESIVVHPTGSANPLDAVRGTPSSEQGVTMELQPSCQGCAADLICTLFPTSPVVQFYYGTNGRGINGSCPPKPANEQVVRAGSDTVRFTDPPNVVGQGAPSGGPYTATGALTYSPAAGASQITCTLAAHDACGVIVDTMLGLVHSPAPQTTGNVGPAGAAQGGTCDWNSSAYTYILGQFENVEAKGLTCDAALSVVANASTKGANFPEPADPAGFGCVNNGPAAKPSFYSITCTQGSKTVSWDWGPE